MAFINVFGETVQGDMPNSFGNRPIETGSTRPEVYTGTDYGGGGGINPSAVAGGAPYGDPFSGRGVMAVGLNQGWGDIFGSGGVASGGTAQGGGGWFGGANGQGGGDMFGVRAYASGIGPDGNGAAASGPYKTPDWLRNSALMLDQSPETQRAFFAANPQYEQDWKNIQAGGNSSFATDGSTLVRSNFADMSPEAANYYRNNQAALLANEGFGHDPTLAYMNYFGGPASIGANNKTQNISTYLQNNRWTPNGIVGANNPLMYARTPYGAGTASMGGQPGPGVQPGTIGGGISAGGLGAGGVTGGVYPPPAGSGGGGGYGGSSASGGLSTNPYLQQQGDLLAQTMTNNWRRQVQPQIASGAVAAGGFGGSRQAVAEANSANDLNMGIGSALANLYGNGYNSSLSYDLGLRNNELGWGNLGLGWGNLGLGQQNLDRQINNDNLSWQLQGANFGLGLQDRLMQNNQIGLATGTQINDNAYNNWNRFSQGANSLGQGYGSTSQSGGGGNALSGVLGGAQLGGRIYNLWNPNSGGGSTAGSVGDTAMGTNFWAPNFSGSMGD